MNARKATLQDREALIAICSHPEVRKWTAFDGAPDFNPDRYFQNFDFAILVEGGAFLCPCLETKSYGVHTNLLPTCRGKDALRAARDAMAFGFLQMEVEEVYTPVPEDNPQADWFCRAQGFRLLYSRENAWLHNGRRWSMNYYKLDIDDWILQGHCKRFGELFHHRIKAAHAEDAAHDSYVGALQQMITFGNVDKGIRIYNRWARSAQYRPLKILSRSPLAIDAHDFIVVCEEGDFRIEEKEQSHA